MKPLMYGYLRVTDDLPDEAIQHMERQLRALAEAEGFCFATTFHEYGPGDYGALAELTEELRRTDARHVVVLSLDHVSRHRLLREHVLAGLEFRANAQVWTVQHGSSATGSSIGHQKALGECQQDRPPSTIPK